MLDKYIIVQEAKVKKTIEKIFCDECGLEVHKTNYFTVYVKYLDKKLDICVICIRKRVNHSFNICEDLICQECRGTGYLLGAISLCVHCEGKGIVSE